jgi:aryl-alcohol dehydrogenase-like predicted oxidoreductase
MLRRQIPGTSLHVSSLALGGWLTLGDRLDDAASLRLLDAAVAAGIDFLDLADVYGNGGAERIVGEFLRSNPGLDLVVSSKVFWPTSDRPEDRGLSRRHIHASIDRTLQRLGRERLEIYFCHREDPSVPLAETVQAMGDLVAAGKIAAWGTSCWRPATLRAAHRLADELGVARPCLEQPRYNLLAREIERDVVPCCRDLGMGIVAWSPLAGGVLTGKYAGGAPAGSRGATTQWLDEYLGPRQRQAVRQFVAECQRRDVPPAATALAWVMQQPGITAAIVGATSPAQLRQNLLACELVGEPERTAWAGRLFPMPGAGWRRLLARFLGLPAR